MVNKVNVAQDITNSTFMIGAFAVTTTGSSSASSGTLHRLAGRITTPASTEATGAIHTITLTNSHITATDMVLCSVARASGTSQPTISTVIPGAGQVVIVIENSGGGAFDSALVVDFWVVKRS